jgi:ABC-type glycerol-3-phosphate transport system permease component
MTETSGRISGYALRIINPILIGLFLFLTIGPIYWVASSSLKSTQEVISPVPTVLPANPTLDNYGRLLQQSNFLTQLRNSVVVAAGTTALTLIVTVLAAFGAYRGNVRWLRKLKFVAILAFVFPTALLVVPIYEILVQIGLVDTIWSGILVNCVLTVPFSFWLVEGFFDSVPRELEEAALVDGANRFQTAFRILLPLITPGLATIAIFAFVSSWTEYTFSSVLLINANIKTIPLGLADILAQYNIDWGLLTTNTTLAMIPGIAFFAIAGRYFISGLVAGALKA